MSKQYLLTINSAKVRTKHSPYTFDEKVEVDITESGIFDAISKYLKDNDFITTEVSVKEFGEAAPALTDEELKRIAEYHAQ